MDASTSQIFLLGSIFWSSEPSRFLLWTSTPSGREGICETLSTCWQIRFSPGSLLSVPNLAPMALMGSVPVALSCWVWDCNSLSTPIHSRTAHWTLRAPASYRPSTISIISCGIAFLFKVARLRNPLLNCEIEAAKSVEASWWGCHYCMTYALFQRVGIFWAHWDHLSTFIITAIVYHFGRVVMDEKGFGISNILHLECELQSSTTVWKNMVNQWTDIVSKIILASESESSRTVPNFNVSLSDSLEFALSR